MNLSESPFVDIIDAIMFIKWFIEHKHYTEWDTYRVKIALELVNKEVNQKL